MRTPRATLTALALLLATSGPAQASGDNRVSDRAAAPMQQPAPTPASEITDIFKLLGPAQPTGWEARLAELIRDGADLTRTNDYGHDPLIAAVVFTSPTFSYVSDIRPARFDHIQLLLASGAKLDFKDKNGNTALHHAAKKGDPNLIALFVERGANVNAVNAQGRTPLFEALLSNPVAVNLLIHLGADIDARDARGETVLHYGTYYASLHDEMEMLLRHGANPFAKNTRGATVLEYARNQLKSAPASADKKRTVEQLERYAKLWKEKQAGGDADAGADGFDPPPKPDLPRVPSRVDPPLIAAVRAGDIDTVKTLLDEGADPDAISRAGPSHMPGGNATGLHLSIPAGHDKITRLLIDAGANVRLRNGAGLHPLYLAAAQDDAGLVKLLLDMGVDAGQPTAQFNRTAMFAAKSKKVITLLADAGADINRQSAFGYTPLHGAVELKDPKLIELLVFKGADVNLPDYEGRTPLHMAIENGDEASVSALLALGADPAAAFKGATPYDTALSRGEEKIAALVREAGGGYGDKEKLLRDAVAKGNVALVRQLLKDGMNPDLGREDNWPLLLMALQSGAATPEMLTVLVEAGADINVFDANRRTPLHLIRDADVAALFLDRGADVNARDEQGHTPLHNAAREGNLELVAALLEHGAKATIRDEHDYTPLHSAASGPIDHRPADGPAPAWEKETPRYLAVISLLVKAGASPVARSEYGDTPLQIASRVKNEKFAAEATRIMKKVK